MCGKVFSCIFYSLIINYLSMCISYRISDLKFEMLPNTTEDISEENNDHDFIQQLSKNNSTNTTENDIIFWTETDVKSTTETNLELQIDTQEVQSVEDDLEENNTSTNIKPSESAEVDQTNENKNNVALPDKTTVPDFTMHEKIMLQRKNCYLEIAIQDSHDLKIEIRFGKLENNSSGQCCITLNGRENNMLGVLISNIHLYENAYQGEILKVITVNHGLNFILKEYHSKSKYEPLLLTETDKVYIVLYYKVTNIPLKEEETYFNLEVFSYKKYGNDIHYGNNYFESYSSQNQEMRNLSTTESSYFVRHFY